MKTGWGGGRVGCNLSISQFRTGLPDNSKCLWPNLQKIKIKVNTHKIAVLVTYYFNKNKESVIIISRFQPWIGFSPAFIILPPLS